MVLPSKAAHPRCGVLAMLLAACGPGAPAKPAQPKPSEAALRQVLGVPELLEVPAVPDYNPPTPEKIALGRRLFYERRLSQNQTMSCSSCHLQRLGFSDGKKTPTGSTGEALRRNSPGLANSAYAASLTWANNGLRTFEDQIPVPIRGDHPVELGVSDAYAAEVLARFDGDPSYQALLRQAFPESTSGATVDKLVFALASFCRTMLSAGSPYDRFSAGETAALTDQQRRGLALFNGERLECFHCHSGANLTVSYHDIHTSPSTAKAPFLNTGLYNVDGQGAYPAVDTGLLDVTLDPADMGRFRPPSLRNVALTAPYMHDGSIATLEDVVLTYAAGGRRIESGPYAGDGRLSPLKSGLVRGFAISDEEVASVVAFLEALTDPGFIASPALSDPGAVP